MEITADQSRKYYFDVHIKRIKETIFPMIDDELNLKLPEWTSLRRIHDSLVCVHTLNVLYCMT